MSPSKRKPGPLKLHLKLRSGVADVECASVLNAARAAGASNIRPLFPKSKDKELASLHTIDVEDDATASTLIRKLSAHPAVEFVEPEVQRSLKSR